MLLKLKNVPLAVIVLSALYFLSFFSLSQTTFADFQSTPVTNIPSPNGSIYAQTIGADGTVYIGGAFTNMSYRRLDGTVVALSDGSTNATFVSPETNGSISAVAADGSGGWFVGGNFSSIFGVAQNNLAHINSDGALDSAWDANTDGEVKDILISGSTVFVGGDFNNANGDGGGNSVRNSLAAFHITTGALLSWDAQMGEEAGNYRVESLAVNGNTIFVGGRFVSINSTTRYNLAALDTTTATLDATWNPNIDGAASVVNEIEISGSTLYVVGAFSSINGGTGRNNAVAVNLTDGTATSWNPNVNNLIRGMAILGSNIYFGGAFTSVGGNARTQLAGVNNTDGTALSWAPNPGASQVYALASTASTIIIGGDFSTINGTARVKVAELDTDGALTSWDAKMTASLISNITISGTDVYLGGDFTISGITSRTNLAAYDSDGNLTSWAPTANGAEIDAMAISGSVVYIGGTFSDINGTGRNNAAAVNTSGVLQTWNPNASSSVWALAVSGSVVYLGGDFSTVDGVTRNHVAAVDATTGSATSWDPNATIGSGVWTLATAGTNVYVGGGFTTIGGQSRNYIAAIDSSTGLATAWNPNPNTFPSVFTVSGSTLYIGGQFTTISSVGRNYAASYDTATGDITSWNPNASANVSGIAVTDSVAYLGGEFTTMGGTGRNRLAAVDATTGDLESWNPNASAKVWIVTTNDTNLYTGGDFTTIGGNSYAYFAKFALVDNPVPTTTSISPTAKTIGDAEFTLTINGTNFIASSVVKLDGVSKTTAYVDATQLTATIPASDIDTASTFSITVFNPTPGGGTSGAQTLTVNNPTPAIANLSPSNIQQGSGAFTLTITGTNFIDGAIAKIDGSNRATTYVDSSTLTVAMLLTDATSAGSYTITVTNPDPVVAVSNEFNFGVYLPPTAYTIPATTLEFATVGIAAGTIIPSFDNIKTDISSDGSSVNFGNLYWTEGKTAALLLRGTTNIAGGYSIYVSENHPLRASGGKEIADFDNNTGVKVRNSNPAEWVRPTGKGYLGYSTSNLARFLGTVRKWAGFESLPKEVVRRTGESGLVSYDDYLLMRLELGTGQEAGIYTNEITVSIVPNL